MTRAPDKDSDKIFYCPHERALGLWIFIERQAKTLISLRACAGRSESSLGAHAFLSALV